MIIFGQNKAEQDLKVKETVELAEQLEGVSLEDLEKVMTFKAIQTNKKEKIKLDPNLIVSSAVGLASILLVLNYERSEIITSKAFGMAQRLIGR